MKKDCPCKASDMYQSSTFKKSYEYATLVADKIYIISAKHGLLKTDKIIEPYDETLKNKNKSEIKEWSQKVIGELGKECDLNKDEFIILAGKTYYKELIGKIKNYCIPLQHEDMFNRISTLNKLISMEQDNKSSYSMKLHKLFNSCKIYDYSNIDEINFENGVYIMFEKGESYGSLNRITRVGTHDKPNRLKKRLKNHFQSKNKDGSIFRKNIGRAILNKSNDDYLYIWNKDTSKRENRKYINKEKQKEVEEQVSEYINNNITFTVFRVDDDSLRLRLEKAIIATINKDDYFYPSKNWLGKYSTEKQIKESGLWLKRGLDNKTITEEEFEFIEENIKNREGL